MSVVKRRTFPESFKREAVDRVATSGLSAGAVAKELGLHETVLRRWMSQFLHEVSQVFARREQHFLPPWV
jgi:transposase-like protein